MSVCTPTNSYMGLMVFFSSEEKPLSRAEMDEFWDSLTPSEKHYYMCADLGETTSKNRHATIKPFENEFSEWYYGQDPQPWCKDHGFADWYYGQDPQPWCKDLPPHYHTENGLIPRQITEAVLPIKDGGPFSRQTD